MRHAAPRPACCSVHTILPGRWSWTARYRAALAGFNRRWLDEAAPREQTTQAAPATASRPATRGRLAVLTLGALLLAGLAIRLALLSRWEGADFRATISMAQLTLHGRDVYGLSHIFLQTHHLSPWTYFPLCLDMYAALTWLSVHTGWPLLVLSKLPVVAADLAVGYLIYMALRRRGSTHRIAAIGAALYLFNPLVLYNGAYYGRFDAIALALLLLALECYRGKWFVPAYALAIAAKTFPLFLLPLLAFGRDRQRPGRLVAVLALTLVLALPYLAVNLHGLLFYLLVNNTGHISSNGLGRLSWYSVLWANHWLSMNQIMAVAHVAAFIFPLALLSALHRPIYEKVAICFILFLVLNRTVYEQYLLWPLPFLIIIALHDRRRLAGWMFGIYTIAGLLENEYTWTHYRRMPWHLLPHPWLALNMMLAVSGLLFVAMQAGRGRVRLPRVALPALPALPLSRLVNIFPTTMLVIGAGLALRMLLVPMMHGADFSQWEMDARATLDGVNIYTHSPHVEKYYQYAYFPLFLYLELPLMWLGLHAHLSFTVLGKLPIMAGDLLTAILIARYLGKRGHRDGVMALGAALYFLNPLVLYNGAFYGRFDALCVGLFLLALMHLDMRERPRPWLFALLYAAAIAAKTYPAFILPWLLIRGPVPRRYVVAALVLVLGGISLPYLLDNPLRFGYDIAFYIGHRLPSGHTWQTLISASRIFSGASVRLFSYALLAVFAAAVVLLTSLDIMTYCGIVILLFLLLSKVVYEQYFLWPMPFLILAALDRRSWSAGGLLALLSAIGIASNEHIHLLGAFEPVLTVAAAIWVLVFTLSRLIPRPYHDQAPAGLGREIAELEMEIDAAIAPVRESAYGERRYIV